ncbi:hypothetical protein PoB_004838400 [Plakobranchus ocellatus]|uniref:Uncharacterized protein n=1 Tax=Plakobranchus ocellatus TaxID=259542 RepID=A0AAV4BST9_9GAST|nr:hypothetical protein PoB_004838400 [Plakobranchus ocellatus]
MVLLIQQRSLSQVSYIQTDPPIFVIITVEIYRSPHKPRWTKSLARKKPSLSATLRGRPAGKSDMNGAAAVSSSHVCSSYQSSLLPRTE